MLRTLLFAALVSAPALAGEHCHKHNPDRTWSDLPEFTSAKVCRSNQGVWLSHDFHCDMPADQKVVEATRYKTDTSCKKAGGKWVNHGHEPHWKKL